MVSHTVDHNHHHQRQLTPLVTDIKNLDQNHDLSGEVHVNKEHFSLSLSLYISMSVTNPGSAVQSDA